MIDQYSQANTFEHHLFRLSNGEFSLVYWKHTASPKCTIIDSRHEWYNNLSIFCYLQLTTVAVLASELGLMRGMAKPSPQRNQELFVVKRQSWKTPRWAWGKQGMWYFSPSVLQHCWLGDRKGIWPVKKLAVGLLVVMIWLGLCTSYSFSCHHRFHHTLLQ